jgi:hypothetical protein
MNIIEKIANLISPPPVNPQIRIASEAFKLSPELAPTRAELEKIHKIYKEHCAAVRIQNSHTNDAIHQKLATMHKEFRDATRSGDLEKIKIDGFATMQSEFEMKRNLAREQIHQLGLEASAMAIQIYKRTVSALEVFESHRERLEAEQCEEFGLELSPSAILRATRDLKTILNNRIRLDAVTGDPKGLYFFLNLEG